MDNLNLDKNTMDKLNSMLSNGNLNDILSQIPPDTLKNFSSMMKNISNSSENPVSNSNANTKFTNTNTNTNSNNNSKNSDPNATNNSFDFNNIDINTMMKMKSILEKMNNSSDARANLLHSLKPYLRNEKKSKLDQYSNLLNMANLIELFNQNNNKENSSD